MTIFNEAKYNNLIMGKTMPQEDIICNQVKLGAIDQRYSMNGKYSQFIVKDIDYSSQTDGKALLMRINNYLGHWTWRNGDCAQLYASLLLTNIHRARK